MKKFYLNGNEVQIELSPTIVETLDESLDNFTVALEINQNPDPIPMHSIFEMKEDDSLLVQMEVQSDNIELVTQNPLRYKHTITLIQTSHQQTIHELRNTSFSTDLETNNFSRTIGRTVYVHWSGEFVGAAAPLTFDLNLTNRFFKEIFIEPRFFIQKSYLRVSTQLGYQIKKEFYANYIKPKTWNEIYEDNTLGGVQEMPFISFRLGNETKILHIDSNVLNHERINILDLEDGAEILEWLNESEGTVTVRLSPNEDILFNFNGWTFDATGTPRKPNIPLLCNLVYSFDFVGVSNSVYDVIETLLMQQMKETKLYNRESDDTIKPLFYLPTQERNEELYNLLKETASPNFVFTQCSMFDALAEIFKLFDATFRIDNDGYLDIEYFNKHDPIEMPESNKAGRNSGLSDERYVNRLISYYQNTKIDDRFPNSNNELATAYLRSKTLGVPGESDFVFATPKPIDIIKKVYIKVSPLWKTQLLQEAPNPSSSDDPIQIYYYFNNTLFSGDKLLDITDFVVESSLWTLLPNDTTNLNPNKRYKSNCLSYTRGTNYIDISGYYNTTKNIKKSVLDNVLKHAVTRFYGLGNQTIDIISFPSVTGLSDDNFWKYPKLSVEYIALVDGKLVNESIENKYEGELLTNQSNGSIDINKLGLNMVGLSLKLGQPTLTLTHKFSSWADRIKKGQFFVDNSGNKWVANSCSYTVIRDDIIQATIEWVKNFNGLAKRIELNQEKRLTNISNELTVKSEETYGEFIYYTDESEGHPSIESEKIAFNEHFIINQIMMTLGEKAQSEIIESTNCSDRIVNTTISQLSSLNGDIKKIYRIEIAYSGVDSEQYVDQESVTIYSGWNNNTQTPTGSQLIIPLCDRGRGAIKLNHITNEFYYDHITKVGEFLVRKGNQLTLYVLKDGDTILGAIIDQYAFYEGDGWDVFETISDFSPSSVVTVMPENDYTLEYALVTALNANNEIIINNEQEVKQVSVPLVVYGSGNSVAFEMSFDSPISAGSQLLDNYNSSIWSGGWFSRIVPYTDEEGQASKFTIDFVKLQEDTTRFFPKMVKDLNDTVIPTYSFGKLEEFAYYKKPNEIFALNYQLHFLPTPAKINTVFISNEFIKNNGFKNGLNNKRFKIRYTTNNEDDDNKDFQYSILDTKGVGYEKEITRIYDFVNNTAYGLNATVYFDNDFTAEELSTIKSWAIVDENNNIYIAVNRPQWKASQLWITFFSRHHRLS